MPMDFPDMTSLERLAEMLKFRKPNEGETEDDFRMALAKHTEPIDFIMAQEVRNKVGWDKWNKGQEADVVLRALSRK